MKTFKDFYFSELLLSEELHKELQNIIDEPDNNPDFRELYDSTSQKLNRFVKHTRKLIKNGEDTGLESDKPKKGSSRAVFFPRDHKPTVIDGKPTKLRTVFKIAFPGQLDRYKTRGERLLGEHQNEVEADHFIRNSYGMLSEHARHDGSYVTNPNGVLAPVVSNHPDHHYLEMGHVDPMKKSDFQRLTRTDTHPKGIKFDDMNNALMKEYHDAHGQPSHHLPPHHTDEFHEHVMSHPFVSNVADMMFNTGFHPGDISPRNVGIWKHPVTGKEHPVISDYGFSDTVANEYHNRRKRMYQI